MQIPENFKQAWLWLGSVLLVIAILIGLKLIPSIGDNDKAMPASITVNGKGEVTAIPDISKFTVTVSETAKTQSDALAKTSEKMNAVIDDLKKLGIAEKDIKTEYTATNPEYSYTPAMMRPCTPEFCPPSDGGKQTITGYISSHTLSVKVRDLEMVDDVQKIFADRKVQSTSGPELSIDEPEKLKLDARDLAIRDARKQAKILADQLGVRLGSVVSFSESGGDFYPMYARADAMMESAPKANPEPEIATGEQKITSNVSITYRIR